MASNAEVDDCDVMKCISGLQNVDYQSPKEACPVGRDAIACMERVINNCAALGDNKDSVQKPLDMAKENFRKACGDSFDDDSAAGDSAAIDSAANDSAAGDSAAGFIQTQSMFMLFPLAILTAIYSSL